MIVANDRRSIVPRYALAELAPLGLLAALLIVGAAPAAASDIHVVDGDTIEIDNTRIRLFGIDAPEAGQLCMLANGGTWPCGKAAIKLLESYVVGHHVECDNRGLDDYGRPLAVCRANGIEINSAMIEMGLAWSFRKYASTYNSLEDRVRETTLGIWQMPTEAPWFFRSHRWEIAKQIAPLGCPIKGNISRRGEKIYHTPWSPWYARTGVNRAKGERWFCDEAEALRAGWRAPRWGK